MEKRGRTIMAPQDSDVGREQKAETIKQAVDLVNRAKSFVIIGISDGGVGEICGILNHPSHLPKIDQAFCEAYLPEAAKGALDMLLLGLKSENKGGENK